MSTRTFPRRWLVVVLALAAFLPYAPSLGFDFVYDDYAQIVETKQLNSWRAVPSYFTGHVWAWKNPGASGTYYRPIFLLWLLGNQTAFGLTQWQWHLTSVLAHTGVTLLVFWTLARLTRDDWVAAGAALLFAVHPVHLESVAWVSGIPDPLMCLFLLGSLLCFLDNARFRRLGYPLFALALLTKETAIVYPAILLAVAWTGRKDGGPDRRAEVAGYLGVALAYLAVRLVVLRALAPVATPIPAVHLVQTWPYLLYFYVRHLAWPSGLSVFYLVPVVSRLTVENFWIPCAVLGVIAVGLVWWIRRDRIAPVGVSLLVLPLLPVLLIRTFGRTDTVHDRYLYLPVMGLGLLLAWAARKIPWRWVRAGSVLAIAAGFAVGSIRQEQYWSDNVTLFLRGVESAPGNEVANQNLGSALLIEGKLPDALLYFLRAVELDPQMPQSLYSAGRIYYELGDYRQAKNYLERAVDASAGKFAFAPPYLYWGLSEWKSGDATAAERVLREALRIKSADDFRDFHWALGQVLKAKGDLAGARAEFEAELRENPDGAKARAALADLR